MRTPLAVHNMITFANIFKTIVCKSSSEPRCHPAMVFDRYLSGAKAGHAHSFAGIADIGYCRNTKSVAFDIFSQLLKVLSLVAAAPHRVVSSALFLICQRQRLLRWKFVFAHFEKVNFWLLLYFAPIFSMKFFLRTRQPEDDFHVFRFPSNRNKRVLLQRAGMGNGAGFAIW